jgi:hypothetical protein
MTNNYTDTPKEQNADLKFIFFAMGSGTKYIDKILNNFVKKKLECFFKTVTDENCSQTLLPIYDANKDTNDFYKKLKQLEINLKEGQSVKNSANYKITQDLRDFILNTQDAGDELTTLREICFEIYQTVYVPAEATKILNSKEEVESLMLTEYNRYKEQIGQSDKIMIEGHSLGGLHASAFCKVLVANKMSYKVCNVYLSKPLTSTKPDRIGMFIGFFLKVAKYFKRIGHSTQYTEPSIKKYFKDIMMNQLNVSFPNAKLTMIFGGKDTVVRNSPEQVERYKKHFQSKTAPVVDIKIFKEIDIRTESEQGHRWHEWYHRRDSFDLNPKINVLKKDSSPKSILNVSEDSFIGNNAEGSRTKVSLASKKTNPECLKMQYIQSNSLN